MSLKAAKTHIPHPKHAAGNPEKFLQHGLHVGLQVASGHYLPDGGDSHVDDQGRVHSTIILKPTDPAAPAADAPV